MLRTVRGDILQAKETIIAHQVNCYGIAGGLAACVFQRWPIAYEDYRQLTGRFGAMGHRADLLGMAHLTGQQPDGKIVASLYGQLYPGQDFRPEALGSALRGLARAAESMGASVALPYKISCGICGGDWRVVYEMIKDTMKNVETTLYIKG